MTYQSSVSFLTPSVLHLRHRFQCSATLLWSVTSMITDHTQQSRLLHTETALPCWKQNQLKLVEWTDQRVHPSELMQYCPAANVLTRWDDIQTTEPTTHQCTIVTRMHTGQQGYVEGFFCTFIHFRLGNPNMWFLIWFLQAILWFSLAFKV